MSGAGAAQRATADRTLHSSLTGTLRGPPAQASGPEGRSGIVTPREKKVSLFFLQRIFGALHEISVLTFTDWLRMVTSRSGGGAIQQGLCIVYFTYYCFCIVYFLYFVPWYPDSKWVLYQCYTFGLQSL